MTVQTWDRKLFLRGEDHSQSIPQRIDLTGWPRLLFFGGYRPLDAGAWRASLTVDLLEGAAHYPLMLEFGLGEDFSKLDYDPAGRPGRHCLIIEKVWTAAVSPVELRLWVMKPVFHGSLEFVEARVESAG